MLAIWEHILQKLRDQKRRIGRPVTGRIGRPVTGRIGRPVTGRIGRPVANCVLFGWECALSNVPIGKYTKK